MKPVAASAEDKTKDTASVGLLDILCGIVACGLALGVAYLLGQSYFLNDFWCHLSWMRITNRLPIEQWYDNNEFTHLDYPVLAGYIHYYMAAIYKYYDPVGFMTQQVRGFAQEKPEVKEGVRMSILLLNLVSYFPAVAGVVLLLFKGRSRLFKMSTIFFLLVFPTYAYIEFSNTQANAPHLAFVILCTYFLVTDRLPWATFFFTLALSYKQVVGPFVMPIAVYIMAREWYLLRQDPKNTMLKMLFIYPYRMILHAIVGVTTLFVICCPLLLHPPAFQNMINVITHFNDRGFIHPMPSIWNVVKDFVGRNRAEDLLRPYINYTFAMIGAVTVFGIPFIFRKPTKHMFAAYYTVVALTMYLFGFCIHEKHVHYACIMILLYPELYRGYLVYLFALTTGTMLPTVCSRHSETSLRNYAAFFTLFSVYYEYWALPRACPPSPKEQPNWFERHSGRLTAGAVASVLCVLVGYSTGSTLDRGYKCFFTSYYEDTIVKVEFVWFAIFYLYAWTVFFKVFMQEEEQAARKEVVVAKPAEQIKEQTPTPVQAQVQMQPSVIARDISTVKS